MYSLRMIFNQVPKSLNISLRTHYHQYNKQKKMWNDLVLLNARMVGLPNCPLEKAKLKIIRYNYRMLDYDGLVGSLKPVVDGLTNANIIKDDSWGVLGQWEVCQVFKPKKEGQMLEVLVHQV